MLASVLSAAACAPHSYDLIVGAVAVEGLPGIYSNAAALTASNSRGIACRTLAAIASAGEGLADP